MARPHEHREEHHEREPVRLFVLTLFTIDVPNELDPFGLVDPIFICYLCSVFSSVFFLML